MQQCARSSYLYLLPSAVQKQVDRAADIVTDLMEEVNKDLFVATAVADITRECHCHRLHSDITAAQP